MFSGSAAYLTPNEACFKKPRPPAAPQAKKSCVDGAPPLDFLFCGFSFAIWAVFPIFFDRDRGTGEMGSFQSRAPGILRDRAGQAREESVGEGKRSPSESRGPVPPRAHLDQV